MTNGIYTTKSIKLQNYLGDNWQYPFKEVGKTAFYLIDDNFLSLLDRYYIEYELMIKRI